MNKLVFLGLIPIFLSFIPNVYATGVRGDSGDDSTLEESICWVNGYDSGFAGMYDKDRARECIDQQDNYNKMWSLGCEDSQRTEKECGDLINNPVEIEDFKALKAINDRTCYDAGREDGTANKTFNKEKEKGCYEFNDISKGYEGGYQSGCEVHTTEATCKLMYVDKKHYCPDHPDIVGCVSFLHNATNKRIESTLGACTGIGDARANIICPQEINPEKYCLGTNNTIFCKLVGNLCDPDGFVKPEYPYCTEQK